MDKVYAIAEYCLVMGNDDGDGLSNETEPVVCISMGVWTEKDLEKVEKRCVKLNKGKGNDDRFEVVALDVK